MQESGSDYEMFIVNALFALLAMHVEPLLATTLPTREKKGLFIFPPIMKADVAGPEIRQATNS